MNEWVGGEILSRNAAHPLALSALFQDEPTVWLVISALLCGTWPGNSFSLN